MFTNTINSRRRKRKFNTSYFFFIWLQRWFLYRFVTFEEDEKITTSREEDIMDDGRMSNSINRLLCNCTHNEKNGINDDA